MSNAFTRMFLEPHAKPSRLSMSRLAALPLFGFGVLWLVVWTGAAVLERELPLPWWAGLALIASGATLYMVNRFSAGPVSVEFSGAVENVNVTEAKPEAKE